MDSSSGAAPQSDRTLSDRAQVLLEINNAIASHLDLAELMRAISKCLRREIPHDFAGLSIYDSELNVLRVHGMEFPDGMQFLNMWQDIPIEGTLPGVAFSSRRTVLRRQIDPNEFRHPLVKDLVSKASAAEWPCR